MGKNDFSDVLFTVCYLNSIWFVATSSLWLFFFFNYHWMCTYCDQLNGNVILINEIWTRDLFDLLLLLLSFFLSFCQFKHLFWFVAAFSLILFSLIMCLEKIYKYLSRFVFFLLLISNERKPERFCSLSFIISSIYSRSRLFKWKSKIKIHNDFVIFT